MIHLSPDIIGLMLWLLGEDLSYESLSYEDLSYVDVS